LQEAEVYLEDRASKGFNVVQAVVLAELDGLHTPNANGDLPLINDNIQTPNEAYFRHVDAIVKLANEKGIYVGMLPSWGCYWLEEENEIYRKSVRVLNSDTASIYGEFLGKRYHDAGVIWILGGDRVPTSEEEYNTVEQLALGLKKGDDGTHLITFHPIGPGRSAVYFHDKPWLDFNMNQSSHGAADHYNGYYAKLDYDLEPVKPTVDGEARYEQIVHAFYFGGIKSIRFDDFDCRQAAWWSVLSGACGHTYGNNNIWQMWQPGRDGAIGANVPWYEAIHHPGARQMGYMKRFFENAAFEKLEPCQQLLVNAPAGAELMTVAKAYDDSVLVAYSPYGEKFTLDCTYITGEYVIQWFDPKYGTYYDLGKGKGSYGIQTFTPPCSGRANDWVLKITVNK